MELDLTVRYLDDLTALNVTLPTKSVAAADAYREALRVASLSPAADLAAGILGGIITADTIGEHVSTGALELAAKAHAHELVRNLGTTFNRAIRDGLREDAERIITELRATFDPAAKAIMDAALHFGPGTTAADVITAKPDVVKRYNSISSHGVTLDAVRRAYLTLLTDVTRDRPDEIAALFVTDADDLNALEETYRDREPWLSLAHHGYTLRLNTPAEAERVVAAAHAKEQARLAAEKAEQVAAMRHANRFALRGA